MFPIKYSGKKNTSSRYFLFEYLIQTLHMSQKFEGSNFVIANSLVEFIRFTRKLAVAYY